jgi:cell division septation protein DedD
MSAEAQIETTSPKAERAVQDAAETNQVGKQEAPHQGQEPESNQKPNPVTGLAEESVTETPGVETVGIDREMTEETEVVQLEVASLEQKVQYRRNLDLYSGKYTVNLGSFRKRARAERFAQELSEKRFDAFCWEIDLPEKGEWHRVSVGYFQTLENAEGFVSQRRLSEKYSVFITRIPGD